MINRHSPKGTTAMRDLPNCDSCSLPATLWGMVNTNFPGEGLTDSRRKVNACEAHRSLLRNARETGTYATNASKGRDSSGAVIDPDATYAALYMRARGIWNQHAICSGRTALEMINNGDPRRLSFDRL